MDEQKNGTPAPRRRRRADVQRPTITEENEADFFQPETPQTERAEAPRPHSEVRKPVQSSVQRQVWEEEYDDFDDVPARKRKKKRDEIKKNLREKLDYKMKSENVAIPEIHTKDFDEIEEQIDEQEVEKEEEHSILYDNVAIPEVHLHKKKK